MNRPISQTRSRIGFKPRRRTPGILIRHRNQAVFHRVLMDKVEPREPRFLEGQSSIPELVHHPPCEGGVNAVEPYRQFAVQMSHQITMGNCGVFKADHEMIVIGKESPRLQNERVGLASSKIVSRKRSSFRPELKSCFRCSVAAVMM